METTTSVDGRIKKEVVASKVEVTRVYKSEWQKDDTQTAEFKQSVETTSFYPTKSVSNNMTDNIFSPEEFGFEAKPYSNNEVRIGWINIPMSATKKSVEKILVDHADACLYRVLSNKPILTNDQTYAVENQITSVDVIGARQAVRYSDTHDVVALRGKLVLDTNAKIQYRAIFFAKTAKPDLDTRTADATEYYASPELQAELNETGQTVL